MIQRFVQPSRLSIFIERLYLKYSEILVNIPVRLILAKVSSSIEDKNNSLIEQTTNTHVNKYRARILVFQQPQSKEEHLVSEASGNNIIRYNIIDGPRAQLPLSAWRLLLCTLDATRVFRPTTGYSICIKILRCVYLYIRVHTSFHFPHFNLKL